MIQDKQQSNEKERFVEQDTLGPPDDYFIITPELSLQLEKFKDYVCTVSG